MSTFRFENVQRPPKSRDRRILVRDAEEIDRERKRGLDDESRKELLRRVAPPSIRRQTRERETDAMEIVGRIKPPEIA